MAGRDADVTTIVHSNDSSDHFWVTCVVNGREFPSSVHAASLKHAEMIECQIERLVRAVYWRAHMDGFDACGEAVRTALGMD